MLGSDPIAALLGAGIDSHAPQLVWKRYLCALVNAGAAVAMVAPDVVEPVDAGDEIRAALNELMRQYPPGSWMPGETTGRLAGAGSVDADTERVKARVTAYYRRITRALGKEHAPGLLSSGAVTPSAAIHLGCSNMTAVTIPDSAALQQWRDWAAEVSGDRRERHTAPTLLLPRTPDSGVYLFRGSIDVPDTMVGQCTVSSGDALVPIPPTRQSGVPVMRLGPCRKLPGWLRDQLSQFQASAATLLTA